MRRSSERARAACAVLLLALACGKEESVAPAGSGAAPATEKAGPAAATGGAPVVASSGESVLPSAPLLAGRSRELVNPDGSAVVLLYHDLVGVPPPFERWVEEDARVSFAKPIDKQGQRELVRRELEAGLRSVHDVGALRITMAANLSDYDPSYGEFTVRALAPSSVVTFDGYREHVELRFGNGLEAQTWKVPAADAQLVRDKVGPMPNASVDVLVHITGAQPRPGGGGTITTKIVEYELRAEPSGDRLARVRVAAP